VSGLKAKAVTALVFAEELAALPWVVQRITADPTDTFAVDPLEEFVAGNEARIVRVRTVTRPAIVLGVAQRDDVIDRAAAEAHGIAVVRRRSGGGAVWLDASSVSWIDVRIGVNDPLWRTDVGEAFWWLGELWANSLRTYDPSLDVAAYRGPLVTNEWSKLICYSGLGPGEVTIGGAKVVGISQKRTREAALFQCGLLHGWDPSMLLHYCVLSDDDRTRAYEDLEDVCATVPPDAVDSFLGTLNAS
jgi:lipoate---protein ligase